MTEELQELEPLEPLSAADPRAVDLQSDETMVTAASVVRSTLPILGAPAFNPAADKEYYRFVFAGVVMFVGCMMPWGPEWEMAGYKTLSGALFLLISIGLIWSWWGAIATGRFGGANLKWVALSLIPFLVTLFALISAFDAPAVRDYVAMGKPMPTGWGEFFGLITQSIPIMAESKESAALAGEKLSNFLRSFGGGQIVVFFGALYAEFAFLLAILGGAKAGKAKKEAARAASSRRR